MSVTSYKLSIQSRNISPGHYTWGNNSYKTEQEAIRFATELLTHKENIISVKVHKVTRECIHTYNKDSYQEA